MARVRRAPRNAASSEPSQRHILSVRTYPKACLHWPGNNVAGLIAIGDRRRQQRYIADRWVLRQIMPGNLEMAVDDIEPVDPPRRTHIASKVERDIGDKEADIDNVIAGLRAHHHIGTFEVILSEVMLENAEVGAI